MKAVLSRIIFNTRNVFTSCHSQFSQCGEQDAVGRVLS